MKFKLLVYTLFIAIIISSCSPGQALGPTITPSPTTTPMPTLTPTPTVTPTPIGRSSGKILFGRANDKVTEEFVNDLFIVDIESKNVVQLTNNSNSKLTNISPMASHTGDKLAFIVAENRGATYFDFPFWTHEVFIMDIDGKNKERISSVPMYAGQTRILDHILDSQPSWSPDDTKLAYSSNLNSLVDKLNPDEGEIYVIDLNTYEQKQLTSARGYSEHPTWSPDGEYITFMSDRDGDWDIYYMKSDGSGKDIKITNNTSTDRFPCWANQENKIIYHSDRDGNLNLYIYDLDIEEEIQVTNHPADEFTARWSPDDKWIVFSSTRDGDAEIYIMNLETNEEIKITDNEFEESWQNWIP